jgi:tetratricopeptide (TPR) repeat protein
MRLPALPRPQLVVLAALAAAAVALAAPARAQSTAPPPSGESPAAREQARQCERLDGEEAVAACRQALVLGIAPPRRAAIRQLLSQRLAALERWEELAAVLRESVQLDPGDAGAWDRLGVALLYGLGRPGDAVPALGTAVRLAPADAATRVDLAVALAAAGRLAEALAAFEEAVRQEPGVLESRPAARAVLDAAREGRRWPH